MLSGRGGGGGGIFIFFRICVLCCFPLNKPGNENYTRNSLSREDYSLKLNGERRLSFLATSGYEMGGRGHTHPGCRAEHAAPLVAYIQGMGLRRQKVCTRRKSKVEEPLQGNVIQEQMMCKV